MDEIFLFLVDDRAAHKEQYKEQICSVISRNYEGKATNPKKETLVDYDGQT
jgi:hypothetical protein